MLISWRFFFVLSFIELLSVLIQNLPRPSCCTAEDAFSNPTILVSGRVDPEIGMKNDQLLSRARQADLKTNLKKYAIAREDLKLREKSIARGGSGVVYSGRYCGLEVVPLS